MKAKKTADEERPGPRLFAKRFVVNIRSQPREDAERVGYLRAGAVLRAKTARPASTDGCRRGWFELETGGFVCVGPDVLAFGGERLPAWRATQPRTDTKLPYVYASIRRNYTPMYRRVPNEQEALVYEESEGPVLFDDGGMPRPRASDRDGGVGDASVRFDAGPATLHSLLGSRNTLLLRYMMRGFLVSLDRELHAGSRHYWRTQSSGVLPFTRVVTIEGSDFQGVHLRDRHWSLPIAYVMSRKARSYTQSADGALKRGEAAPYRLAVSIVEERTVRNQEYIVASDGLLYRADETRRIEAAAPPAVLGEHDKWIDVDLATQSLVAYEGRTPVFVTLVSSGRVRDPEDPLRNHATPTGTYRLTSKHLATTMDGDHVIDGPYSIDDVPYVMYFEQDYALHSAFWHDLFGRPKSHGCVNMAPLDARWLYNWSDPEVPRGWHGAYPVARPGTLVVIRGETPD